MAMLMLEGEFVIELGKSARPGDGVTATEIRHVIDCRPHQ